MPSEFERRRHAIVKLRATRGRSCPFAVVHLRPEGREDGSKADL